MRSANGYPLLTIVDVLIVCRGPWPSTSCCGAGAFPRRCALASSAYPFGAHAWVECLGEALDDATDDWQHEPYVPILSTREPV